MIMKKVQLITAGAFALLMASCGHTGERSDATNDSTMVTMSRAELESTLQTQDTLLALVNDISDDMMQLKEMEQILSTPASIQSETPSKKQQLKNDIAAVKQALADRRTRLAELEKKIKQHQGENAKLLKTIETLKGQIAQNESQIQELTTQLTAANVTIANLNTTVDSLHSTVAEEKAGREQAIKETQTLTNELNTCYYALGSKKELEQHKIIKTGFLRKTKIMQGDFEMSYFTPVDKRTLTALPLHSKKAKVMTNQPSDSYQIAEGENGEKVLQITNPTRFWSTSNFLVVQVD